MGGGSVWSRRVFGFPGESESWRNRVFGSLGFFEFLGLLEQLCFWVWSHWVFGFPGESKNNSSLSVEAVGSVRVVSQFGDFGSNWWCVGWVLWVMLFGLCWDLSCGSCCLGLKTERVVLVGDEWESSGSTMKEWEMIICFFFSFLCLPNQRWKLQSLNLICFCLFFILLIKSKIEKSGKNMKN